MLDLTQPYSLPKPGIRNLALLLSGVRAKIISVDKNFKQKFSSFLAFGRFLLVPMLAQPVGEGQVYERSVLQSRTGKESCMLQPV